MASARPPLSVLVGAIVGLAGCFAPTFELPACPDGLCPAGQSCRLGACYRAICDDASEGEVCSTTQVPIGSCIVGACTPDGCGDRVVDPGELCDDGNHRAGDGCSPDCLSDESCGNGVPDPGEQCDDGIAIARSGDGCSVHCDLEYEGWQRTHLEKIEARRLTGMTYDEARGWVVVFGGESFQSTLGDTWELDETGWIQRTPPVSPPARSAHVMTYDAARHRVVLFGGQDVDQHALGDTWMYDGTTWTEQHPVHSPPARTEFGMTYDSDRERVVLVGGFSPGTPGMRRADAWEWNGVDWTERTPLPSAGLFSATYDAQRHVVVLVGEDANGLATTYEGSPTTWTARTPPPELANSKPGLAYDPIRHVSVLVDTSTSTYEWDGTTWSSRGDFAIRHFTALAFDARRGAVVAFGGDPTNGVRIRDAFVLAASWELLDPLYAPYVPALAYDGEMRTIVAIDTHATWTFDGTWKRSHDVTTTPIVVDPVGAYDPDRRRFVVVTDPARETWELAGTTWTHVAVTGPRPGSPLALAYDTKRHRLIAHDGVATFAWDGTMYTAIGDGASIAPAGSMAYDEAADRLVLVAGDRATWTFDGTTWTHETPAIEPSESGSLVYDPAAKVIVLTGTSIGTTWEWHAGAWSQHPSIDEGHGSFAPPPVAYDPIARVSYRFENGDTTVWGYARRPLGDPLEACFSPADQPLDVDGDGFAGCDDPDCAARCPL